jgi:hypothetical protein
MAFSSGKTFSFRRVGEEKARDRDPNSPSKITVSTSLPYAKPLTWCSKLLSPTHDNKNCLECKEIHEESQEIDDANGILRNIYYHH